jgi:hypothetical protein
MATGATIACVTFIAMRALRLQASALLYGRRLLCARSRNWLLRDSGRSPSHLMVVAELGFAVTRKQTVALQIIQSGPRVRKCRRVPDRLPET